MIPKFIPTNREQQYLFPPSIQDWLPEEHLARFVVDIVSQLNLQPLAEIYTGKGLMRITLKSLSHYCSMTMLPEVSPAAKLRKQLMILLPFVLSPPTPILITIPLPLSASDFLNNCSRFLSRS
jgi:hypothetical protein